MQQTDSPVTLVPASAFKGFSIAYTLEIDPIKLAAAWAERAAVEALYAKHNLFGYGRK